MAQWSEWRTTGNLTVYEVGEYAEAGTTGGNLTGGAFVVEVDAKRSVHIESTLVDGDGEETAAALRAAPITKVEIIDGLRARGSQTRASEPVVRVQKYRRMARFGRFSREAART